MRQLADIEQQIDTSFKRRVRQVLAEQGSSDAALVNDEEPLFELLDRLNDIYPGIALRFGLARNILDLGLLGYTVLSCRDVGQALDVIYRYHALTSAEYEVRLVKEDNRIRLLPLVRPRSWKHRVVVAEEFVTGFWVVLEELLPRHTDRERVEMHFDYPEPEYGNLYGRAMPCRIRFESKLVSLSFPADWGELPLQTADATVEAVCRTQCDELLEEVSPSSGIVDDVRRVLLAVPASRRPKLDEVAAQLLMSTRTLERRLLASGRSFRSIDSEVRMGLAAQYVALGSMTGKQIASALGYSDPAAFYRAFRQWHKMTPTEYRESQPSR